MIIAGHYFGDPSQTKIKNDFQFHVLENTRFNWSLKREILAHILRTDNLDGSNLGDLDRLNAIRNIFAHRQFVTDQMPQTDESEIYFIDLRHPFDKSRNIPAEAIKNEYATLAPATLNWLYDLAKKKGNPLP